MTTIEHRELKSRWRCPGALAAGFMLTLAVPAAAEPVSTPGTKPGGYQYFIGIVGNPSSPDISWSDEELTKIKALGVNMVQLSIAWGWKPANEVLNLEDLDEEQRANFAYRIKQAEKHGLRTIAHFGVPRMLNDSPIRPACIMDPAVREKYVNLFSDFMTSFPEVDDIMIYTYDQQAWICSEFGPCPRCSGLPLHERLPGFINLLNETMQKHRPDTRLWWKPWELSKGLVWKTARSVRSKSLHLLETLAAQDARNVQADERQFALVVKRLESLLKKDVENQDSRAEVAQKLVAFQRDSKAWL